jgi:hypothetical protein
MILNFMDNKYLCTYVFRCFKLVIYIFPKVYAFADLVLLFIGEFCYTYDKFCLTLAGGKHGVGLCSAETG